MSKCDAKKLLERAASAKVKVVDSERSWIVLQRDIPVATFEKRFYPKDTAEIYADGLALRIAARNE